jgi:hypothetical protein
MNFSLVFLEVVLWLPQGESVHPQNVVTPETPSTLSLIASSQRNDV